MFENTFKQKLSSVCSRMVVDSMLSRSRLFGHLSDRVYFERSIDQNRLRQHCRRILCCAIESTRAGLTVSLHASLRIVTVASIRPCTARVPRCDARFLRAATHERHSLGEWPNHDNALRAAIVDYDRRGRSCGYAVGATDSTAESGLRAPRSECGASRTAVVMKGQRCTACEMLSLQ